MSHFVQVARVLLTPTNRLLLPYSDPHTSCHRYKKHFYVCHVLRFLNFLNVFKSEKRYINCMYFVTWLIVNLHLILRERYSKSSDLNPNYPVIFIRVQKDRPSSKKFELYSLNLMFGS